MAGITDWLMGPSQNNAEDLLRLIAEYKTIDTVGDYALKRFTRDDEMENLTKQNLKLDVQAKARALGVNYGDSGEYEDDLNDDGKDRLTSLLGGMFSRKYRSSTIQPGMGKSLAPGNPLMAVFKEAHLVTPELETASHGNQLAKFLLRHAG
jgi:hypothetical protein